MAIHDVAVVPSAGASLVSVDGKSYPLEAARIDARAEGGIAATTLVQAYANPHDVPLEVLYTLPLPADGAVLGYTIRIGEKVIRGEVRPREKAEAAYREALYAGKTAGLLEQTRPDTFQQRLGNVPPRTRVEVSIDVLHPLAFLTDAGAEAGPGHDRPDAESDRSSPVSGGAVGPQWEYRFPTVAGVRYHGAPGRVADAADLSPDRARAGEIPTRFDLAVTIAGAPGVAVSSPSHTVSSDATEDGASVRFVEGERLDRDVVLRWAACAGGVGVRVVEGKGLAGDDGRYALVTLVPPAAPAGKFRRDLTVLIDASGSMGGVPLATAKRVIGDLLRGLDEGDRFEMLAFANDVRRFTRGMQKHDAGSLRKALEALESLQAGGGTEMLDAVRAALAPLRDDSQRQVVLVTDGYIGFESEVAAEIGRQADARVHVVGIGSAPNRSLTQQVAAAGRGLELFAADESSAYEAGRRLRAGTARPVLTSVTLTGTAPTGARLERLRDVFAGQPLIFTTEMSHAGGTLELRGDLPGGREWTERIDVPPTGAPEAIPPTALPIGALHGRAVIADLELRIAGPEPASGIAERIEATGMRHRIASRRTSLVAIADEPTVDPRAPRRRERLAVEVPAGVSAEGAGLMAGFGGTLSSQDTWAASGEATLMLNEVYGAAKMLRSAPAMPKATLRRLDARVVGADLKRRLAEFLRLKKPSIASWVVEDVRWLSGNLLAFELSVPDGPVVVPGGRVHLLSGAGSERFEAEIVTEMSTTPGRHDSGAIVKLVLRLPAEASWEPGQTVVLYWESDPAATGPAAGTPVVFSFELPADGRPGETQAT